MKLTIINRSQWPTPAIKVLAKWVLPRAGITWDYSVLVRRCTTSFGGIGYRTHQTIRLNRHYLRLSRGRGPLWPTKEKDHRFKWSHVQTFNNRLELLVMLLAHEAYHATGGNPKHFQENGRTNRDSMEFRCNKFADETIVAFRKDWPLLKSKIVAAMRKDRQKSLGPTLSISDKLLRANRHLLTWNRKLNMAKTKIHKYTKRVRYYERKCEIGVCPD